MGNGVTNHQFLLKSPPVETRRLLKLIAYIICEVNICRINLDKGNRVNVASQLIQNFNQFFILKNYFIE